MDMNVETIEKIQELSEPNIVSENSYVYTDKPLSLIHPPKVETIFLSTLDSLVNVVKAEVLRYDGALIVHVDNEREVYVYSGINEADGGAWKLEARRNIYNYLSFKLEELINKGEVIVIA